jgi:hypothetical protein
MMIGSLAIAAVGKTRFGRVEPMPSRAPRRTNARFGSQNTDDGSSRRGAEGLVESSKAGLPLEKGSVFGKFLSNTRQIPHA